MYDVLFIMHICLTENITDTKSIKTKPYCVVKIATNVEKGAVIHHIFKMFNLSCYLTYYMCPFGQRRQS